MSQFALIFEQPSLHAVALRKSMFGRIIPPIDASFECSVSKGSIDFTVALGFMRWKPGSEVCADQNSLVSRSPTELLNPNEQKP